MRWVPIVAVILSVLVAGCGKGNFSERASVGKETVFRYPIPELTKLDPAMVQDGDTIDIIQNVFEGLVTWGEDNKVHPNLAESWDVSKDGLTYTFHLKKGVKFHNGREMTADDVKYSFERVANPALSSPTVLDYLDAVVGVKEKMAKKANDVSGVKVIDSSTVSITINKPLPYFLGLLTYPTSFVVAKEAAPPDKEILNVGMMVGTGPFKAESFAPNQLFVMAAFAGYHGGAPQITKIERPIIKDALTRLNKFKSGELDMTRVERGDIPGILNDPALKPQLKMFDRPSTYYVGMNVSSAPFNNKLVRQAFAMAIDRDEICKDVLLGLNQVANSLLPPSVPGYRANGPEYPFNPQKAKTLLAQAGYPDGKGFPPVVMNHRSGQTDVKLVAEALVTQLRKNLGISATTQEIPWTTYLERHNHNELPLFHMRWAADYLDAQDFLSLLLATYGSENHVGYSNPQFDAICKQADSMVGSDSERIKLYQKAEDIGLEDAAFVTIYYEKDAELISPRVQGMRESAFGHLAHTTLHLQ